MSTTAATGETRATRAYPIGAESASMRIAEHFCTGFKQEMQLTGCKILSYRAALYIPHR